MVAPEPKRKLCFVVGPIGDAADEIRTHADWLLKEIIQPVMAEFPYFNVVRADKISQPGMIDAQIIQHLLDADLVIADLSKENPNAFYEIGIRHMAQRPIIHMQLQDEKKIPFDVSLYRATKFSLARPADLKRARADLKDAVSSVLTSDYKVDNPITRARGQIKLQEHATPEQRQLINQMRALQDRIESLEENADSNAAMSVDASVKQKNPRKKNFEIYVHFDDSSGETREQIFDLIRSVRWISDVVLSMDTVGFTIPAETLGTKSWFQLQERLQAIPGVKKVNDLPF